METTPSVRTGQQLSDFSGNWLLQSRNILLYPEATLLIINTEASTWTWYPGNLDYVRNYHGFDSLISTLDDATNVPVNQTLVNGVLTVTSNNLNFTDPGFRYQLTLEDNGDILRVTSPASNFYPYDQPPHVAIIYFKRLLTLPPSLTQSLTRPNEVNWNRFDLLFRFWVNNFLYTYGEVATFGTDYFDLEAFKATADLFLCGKGVVRTAEIEWVYKSTTLVSYQPSILLGDFTLDPPTISYYGTSLWLKGFHKITRASRVTITGYTGDWAVMNGEWNLDPYVFSNSVDWPKERAFPCSTRRLAIIPFDSRSLPDYNPKLHGCGQIQAFHRSLNRETSNYRDFAIAFNEIIRETGFSTHNRGFVIAIVDSPDAPPRIPDTYEEIRTQLRTDASRVVSVRVRSRTYPVDNASMYFNPTQLYTLATTTIFQFDWNNPFGVSPNDPYYDYFIVLQNYLASGTARVPYFRINQDPSSADVVIGPPDETPEGFSAFGSLLLAGLVNPSKTRGKRVGYVWFQSVFYTDPSLSFLSPSFNPAGNSGFNATRVVGLIMQYLVTTLAVDEMIVDIRNNEGGFITYDYLAACAFGGKRIYPATTTGLAGTLLPIANMSQPVCVDPGILESVAPGSVFHGTPGNPKKVILITDINAASGGDIFPVGFIGDRGDGDLGNYTQACIIGSIDGRIADGVITALFPPVNPVSRAALTVDIFDIGTLVVPPYEYETGTISTFYAPQEGRYMSYFLCSENPDLLIPHDFSVAYRDIGLLKPTIAYLDGVEPQHNDRSTWQDTYLENALRIILNLQPCVPPAFKYLQASTCPDQITAKVGPSCENQDERQIKSFCEFPNARIPCCPGSSSDCKCTTLTLVNGYIPNGVTSSNEDKKEILTLSLLEQKKTCLGGCEFQPYSSKGTANAAKICSYNDLTTGCVTCSNLPFDPKVVQAANNDRKDTIPLADLIIPNRVAFERNLGHLAREILVPLTCLCNNLESYKEKSKK